MERDNKHIGIVGTGKPKLIIMDEITPFTQEQFEILEMAHSKTLTPTGIKAEGIAPSAGEIFVMQGNERIDLSSATFKAIHSLTYDFQNKLFIDPPYDLRWSGSFRITPETFTKGTLMAMILGYEVPEYMVDSLRKISNKFISASKILCESIKALGLTSKVFNRRYRRRKKLCSCQGKRRKRQIEKARIGR